MPWRGPPVFGKTAIKTVPLPVLLDPVKTATHGLLFDTDQAQPSGALTVKVTFAPAAGTVALVGVMEYEQLWD
jgi:hypothetical protein